MTEYKYLTASDVPKSGFYKIPKGLFKHPKFRKLSDGAKLLYIAIANRYSLSLKNGYKDDSGRVYVYYSIETVCEELGCSASKAVRIFKELDVKTGVGLIDRKRLGLGKTSIIYLTQTDFDKADPDTSVEAGLDCENDGRKQKISDVSDDKNDKSELVNNAKNENIFFDSISDLTNHTESNEEISGDDNDVSEMIKTLRLEMSESECNKIELNKNKLNKIDLNKTESNLPIHKPCVVKDNISIVSCNGWAERKEKYKKTIKENISYNILVQKIKPSWLDEIVELMANTVSLEVPVRVGDVKYPPEAVRERFLSLESDHIEYVNEFLKKNKYTVKNIRAYLTAILFNAPETMISWYNEEAKKDGML